MQKIYLEKLLSTNCIKTRLLACKQKCSVQRNKIQHLQTGNTSRHNAISLRIKVIKVQVLIENNSILKDESYQNSVRKIISNIQEKDLTSSYKWGLLKITVREFTEKICSKKTIKKREKNIYKKEWRFLEN